jgi:hypothetical protein
MLVPLSSWTLDIRDMASKTFMKALRTSSQGRDKYQLGLTMVVFHASMLKFLDDLRANSLRNCAVMIQKNLKAKDYRRKYLEARSAILLIYSIIRGYLTRLESHRISATITIQRVWYGHKQCQRFNSIRGKSLDAVGPADGGGRGFTLSEDLRSKLRRIKTIGLENARAFFYTMQYGAAFIDVRPRGMSHWYLASEPCRAAYRTCSRLGRS